MLGKKKKQKLILWFSEAHKEDIPLVGGKGANLGELYNAKIPVPNGFIVTADAYFYFLEKTNLKAKIANALKGIDPEDNRKLNTIAKQIKQEVINAKMPEDLQKVIKEYYRELGGFSVAVRSSATAEDLPDASFAGQQATFLNITGGEEVVEAVQKCFASLFEARAIYYRIINKFDHMKVGLAVPVQTMIDAEYSGVMFTIDPVSEDTNKLSIEAGYGFGEAIVSGSITPDRYVIDKEKIEIMDKEINDQPWKIIKSGKEGSKHVDVPHEKRKAQKLPDDQILELAKIGLSIEKHYGKPQDTEFAIEKGKIYMVQSRPITTLGKQGNKVSVPDGVKDAGAPSESTDKGDIETDKAEVILKGAAASLGIAFGPVKLIHKPEEIDKVMQGDVLVTEQTTPDFVPAMRRAKAIVTDTGGRTCHAAIVSRELGIPCVVGAGTATHVLKTGQMITVDGAKGLVYKGKVKSVATPEEVTGATGTPGNKTFTEEVPITGTKVYVNLAEPHLAEKIAAEPVDGVGLLRAEFMIAEIGEHPRAMVEDGRGKEYVDKLSEGMRTFAQAFAPRPVVYRATDFKTNEYKGLKGGEKYEPVENNPMIGYRGASRYIKEPDLFKLELDAMKRVRDEYDLKNLWLMIPFVRTVEEMKKVKQLVEANGLVQSNDFKLWMMCEIPSNVILLDKFLDLGIDGISIGSNDLTQLTLGADRDNQELAESFDERNEAVVSSIQYVIKTCRRRNITCSICGQAPSVYPEITEMMVKAGTTSVSVSPDMILQTRKIIASVERRLMLSKIIDR